MFLFGRAGSGKTVRAREYAAESNKIPWQGQFGKWMDGYDNHKCIIYDELRKDNIKQAGGYSALLTVSDKYPCLWEQKGKTCMINADLMIFTSPVDPENIWAWFNEEG